MMKNCMKWLIAVALVLALVLVEMPIAMNGQNVAKAASVQYASGFYAPMEGLRKSSGYSGFIPNRVISESSNSSAHLAQDYVSTLGNDVQWKVFSIYDGVVDRVHNELSDGAGRYVIVKHQLGGLTVYSIYQHLATISVYEGQRVSGGDVLGTAGRSGTSENQYAKHLHLGIYSGSMDAWAPRQTSYGKNVEASSPVTVVEGDQKTTYYSPERVFSGECVIGNGDYLEFPFSYEGFESTTVKVIKGCNLKADPYAAADNVGYASQQDILKVQEIVKNKHGNIWLKTNKGFIYGGYATNSDGSYQVEGNQHVQIMSEDSKISFSDVEFPSRYKISKSGWNLGSGLIKSEHELVSVTSTISDVNNNPISSSTVQISGKSFEISKLDTFSASDNGVHFSWISQTGNYKWTLTATNSKGQSKTIIMLFKAVSDGSTTTSTASSNSMIFVPHK